MSAAVPSEGEWIARERSHSSEIAVVGAELPLGWASSYNSQTSGPNPIQRLANARLWAAGKELMAVAVTLDAHWTQDYPNGPDDPNSHLAVETLELWRHCRAAVAKARGQ